MESINGHWSYESKVKGKERCKPVKKDDYITTWIAINRKNNDLLKRYKCTFYNDAFIFLPGVLL